MKRRLLFFLLLVLPAAGALACTTTANVGDLSKSDPEAGAPGRDGEAPDASSSDAPSSDGDGGLPSVDRGCGVTFAQEATFIDIQVNNGSPPPHLGGTVVPGTYVLTAISVYYAGATGTARVRETMVVRGSAQVGTLDVLTETKDATGSFKNATLHGESTQFDAPGGSAFFMTPQCPKKSFETTGAHSAQADTLLIFDDQAGFERTYRRLR